jgi:hypothetical protein
VEEFPEELRLTDEERLFSERASPELEALRVRTDLETFASEDGDVPLSVLTDGRLPVERVADVPVLVELSLTALSRVDLVFVPSLKEVLRLVSPTLRTEELRLSAERADELRLDTDERVPEDR